VEKQWDGSAIKYKLSLSEPKIKNPKYPHVHYPPFFRSSPPNFQNRALKWNYTHRCNPRRASRYLSHIYTLNIDFGLFCGVIHMFIPALIQAPSHKLSAWYAALTKLSVVSQLTWNTVRHL
jgi:hypothetical protein